MSVERFDLIKDLLITACQRTISCMVVHTVWCEANSLLQIFPGFCSTQNERWKNTMEDTRTFQDNFGNDPKKVRPATDLMSTFYCWCVISFMINKFVKNRPDVGILIFVSLNMHVHLLVFLRHVRRSQWSFCGWNCGQRIPPRTIGLHGQVWSAHEVHVHFQFERRVLSVWPWHAQSCSVPLHRWVHLFSENYA